MKIYELIFLIEYIFKIMVYYLNKSVEYVFDDILNLFDVCKKKLIFIVKEK